ncbi:molybdenum cofactor biosynthesis protein, partial [Streptomyces sp. SID10244]|nr:molybdenum cofactor biosynthesis protein [Streptomyces sp. SID10244]
GTGHVTDTDVDDAALDQPGPDGNEHHEPDHFDIDHGDHGHDGHHDI